MVRRLARDVMFTLVRTVGVHDNVLDAWALTSRIDVRDAVGTDLRGRVAGLIDGRRVCNTWPDGP
jgi:hypothetical protein